MIRIMILDDDEMYLKKKRISQNSILQRKRRLHGNDIPECGMVSAGIE